MSESDKKYYQEHREQRRLQNKEYNNRPEIKAYHKEYNNRPEIRSYQREYSLKWYYAYHNDPEYREKILKRSKASYLKHREERILKARIYYSRPEIKAKRAEDYLKKKAEKNMLKSTL